MNIENSWNNNNSVLTIKFKEGIKHSELLFQKLHTFDLIALINEKDVSECNINDELLIHSLETSVVERSILLFEDDYLDVTKSLLTLTRRYTTYNMNNSFYVYTHYNNEICSVKLKQEMLDNTKLLLDRINLESDTGKDNFKISPEFFKILEEKFSEQKERFSFYKNLYSMFLFADKVIISKEGEVEYVEIFYYGEDGKTKTYKINLNDYMKCSNNQIFELFELYSSSNIDEQIKSQIIKYLYLNTDDINKEENLKEKFDSIHKMYISNKSKEFFLLVKELLSEQHKEYVKFLDIRNNAIKRFSTSSISILAAGIGLYISTASKSTQAQIIKENRTVILVTLSLFVCLFLGQFIAYVSELLTASKYKESIKKIYEKDCSINGIIFDEYVKVDFSIKRKWLFWIQIAVLIVIILVFLFLLIF